MAANPWLTAYNSGMPGLHSPTEELIEDFRHGRQADESFRILFRRYFAQVQWFFQRKGASPEDARDMTQEVFLSVFRGLGQLQDAGQFTTWLFVIARNVFSHNLEKRYAQKRSWAAAAGDSARSPLDPDDVPDSRAANAAEEHDTLDEAAFERAAASGAFAFWWAAHGLKYGIPSAIDDALRAGKTVICNTSRAIVPDLRARYARLDVVLVTAPPAVLAARLAGRARASDQSLDERLKRSAEFVDFRADHVIDTTGAPEQAIARLIAIIRNG